MFFHKETIIRTILLIITWLNMILSHYGLDTIPIIGEETVAIILAGIVTIWSWFRNNYITIKKGKKQYDMLKENKLIK